MHVPAGLVAVWFQLIAAFSMTPLLRKDGQTAQCIACCAIYLGASLLLPAPAANPVANSTWTKAAFALSMLGAAVIQILSVTVPPPPHLPDLYALLTCTYSFAHFACFFLYAHARLFSTPPASTHLKKE